MPIRIPVYDERAIKAEYLTKLWRDGAIDRRTVLASEYRLQSAGVRADLAFLTNHLTGVEIKSGKDTLKRLRQQMSVYRSYFDRVVLIVVPRHLDALLDTDVEGIELWTFDSAKNFRMLKNASVSDKSSHRHSLLPARVVKRHAELSARDAFDKVFRENYSHTSERFWKAVGRSRRISAEKLGLLSPFRERRDVYSEWLAQKEQRWVEWEEKAAAAFSDEIIREKLGD